MNTPKRKAAMYADHRELDRLALQLLAADARLTLQEAYQMAMESVDDAKTKAALPTA